ncbi:protein-cysteine N-palmitoyltransferase Rasp [Amyelois transitella]|uniref:protein-cysteine N-palmitoyltransferase Rasp n=1 Tax=Amyelois transitella TaxID=680683 RepID=UPI00298FA185|nr:protein-cysteine N-palmitoyltransferase Rasp [Amyelois transitella]
MDSKLNKVELFAYFSVWIFANIFSLYKLYVAQTSILDNNSGLLRSIDDLTPGWRFISRLKDVSDIEWISWKYFIQKFWYSFIIQFSVSELIRRTNVHNKSFLKYWYIMSSIFFVIFHMGYRQFILIIAQPLIFFTIIILGGKKLSIWFTGIILLVCYNSLKYKYFFWYFLDNEELKDEEVYLVLFTVAWIELRCISFCIDYVEKKRKIQDMDGVLPSALETLVNMLSYVLYLPLLYIGPMILYEDFEKSFYATNELLWPRLKRFISDILLYQIYSFCLDVAFHYIYFYAMQSNMEALRKLPPLALCGGGLWMGIEFHLKYVISYGTTSAFARLDHLEPPPTPRCIARVHVYSQMWRYFDVGLYKFLVKYIYKPSFNTLIENYCFPKMVYKLFASFAAFLFIFMWHGTAWNIFIWSVLNYLGITLEVTGKVISETAEYKWFKENILQTDQMETRFTAMLCAPLLAVSAVSNFYLFAGTKVGDLFFERLAQPTFWNSIIISLALYSCCQVSMALKNVSSRSDRKINDAKFMQ